MRPDQRAELARLAYQRAVALARARSTPTSWRRLLTAARNLRAAATDRAILGRRATGGCARVPAGTSLPGAAQRGDQRDDRRSSKAETAAPGECPVGGRTNRDVAAGVLSPPSVLEHPDLRLEVSRELERAHALVAWSRRLVQEARAVRRACAELRSALVFPTPSKA